MSDDILTLTLHNVRATDSNSLLRLYDRARQMFSEPGPQLERLKAAKAVERITNELHRRRIPL